MQAIESESKQIPTVETSAVSQVNFGAYGHRAVSFLARNFYNLKYVALVLAFCINFMLLFYKVPIIYHIIKNACTKIRNVLLGVFFGWR